MRKLGLYKQLQYFKKHTFIKRKQSDTFEQKRKSADGHHIVVQVDFAENYAAIEQNEIQSAHWCHLQVTLFTVCAWVNKDTVDSGVIVSDDLQHGKFAVHTFLVEIISSLKEKYPSVEKIEFFSDGAASQFKQKFLFSNLSFLQEMFHIQISWHFFATSHGKGKEREREKESGRNWGRR